MYTLHIKKPIRHEFWEALHRSTLWVNQLFHDDRFWLIFGVLIFIAFIVGSAMWLQSVNPPTNDTVPIPMYPYHY
jgi:hypothetical protein